MLALSGWLVILLVSLWLAYRMARERRWPMVAYHVVITAHFVRVVVEEPIYDVFIEQPFTIALASTYLLIGVLVLIDGLNGRVSNAKARR